MAHETTLVDGLSDADLQQQAGAAVDRFFATTERRAQDAALAQADVLVREKTRRGLPLSPEETEVAQLAAETGVTPRRSSRAGTWFGVILLLIAVRIVLRLLARH